MKINIGFESVPSMLIPKNNVVLELQTRKLPTQLSELEKIRELTLVLFNYLTTKKMVEAHQ